MHIYPIIRDLYGQLRGYRRWSIRREAVRNMQLSTDALRLKSEVLRKARYLSVIQHYPAYANLVSAHTGQSDLASISFEQLPILTKSDLISILSAPSSLISALSSKIYAHSTGGSTGQPFRFFITRESYEWRTAVSDRGYSWALAEEGLRSFYVWGTTISKLDWRQRIKTVIHHWLQNRHYFDSFVFDDARKAECCRQINRFKPVSLVGYAGNLVELAQYVSRNPGVLTWRAKTAVTAAEGLQPGMRELLEKCLADEVFMSYGSREFMLIGMEGPDHDGYYLSADNLYVEVVDERGKPCAPGEIGRIVVTDLHNDATPFVRYAIGDLGHMGSDAWSVECGQSTLNPRLSTVHSFPRLASVEGREQEVIVLVDGSRLTALFVPHMMKEFDWVEGYQIVQEAPGEIVMNLVTGDGEWQLHSSEIERLLREKLGENMRITFERVDQLQKNVAAKIPIVLNRR